MEVMKLDYKKRYYSRYIDDYWFINGFVWFTLYLSACDVYHNWFIYRVS